MSFSPYAEPLLTALSDPGEIIYLLPGGEMGGPGDSPLAAIIPVMAPGNFGSKAFRKEFNLRYAYVGGAMVGGISSAAMVEALADISVLGIFGASGLSPVVVEDNIVRLKERLGSKTFGSCLIHSPQDPTWEEKVVEIYLRHGVDLIEASAFTQITPSLVRYRLQGLKVDQEGEILAPNRIMAKVSRLELARRFFSPPPPKIVKEILAKGWITAEEAALAERIPMAQDLTAEADSGGHTDFRPALTLWPSAIALAQEMTEKHGYQQDLRIGAAGGLGAPPAFLAAQDLGVAYFVTGSINQSCVESGLSEGGRELLAKASQTDVAVAPAADMFELGARVQVLKYGTLFAPKAQKLVEFWRRYQSLEDIPEAERLDLEDKIFKAPLADIWSQTAEFFKARDPEQLAKAEKDPHFKLALIFRWYLGQASRWAINGVKERRSDWCVFAGPSIGAFNEWVAGTFLSDPANRTVALLAQNLLYGLAVYKRMVMAKDLGFLPDDLCQPLKPLTAEKLAPYI
ncbi:MAG: PfaD family polyunsaturated fatty acid/polyketide biosynthesis protein [Deltaproteobacteria bacterium]|jgi:PfaD family protein|nr:PfaD family polyunsaturated fatty acid/polyketide biosynthesis protein [Deltaproteobacteria bacterium]